MLGIKKTNPNCKCAHSRDNHRTGKLGLLSACQECPCQSFTNSKTKNRTHHLMIGMGVFMAIVILAVPISITLMIDTQDEDKMAEAIPIDVLTMGEWLEFLEIIVWLIMIVLFVMIGLPIITDTISDMRRKDWNVK